MKLSLPKVFPFLIIALFLAAGIFHFTFSRYTASQLPPGCVAQTADGELGLDQTVAFWQNQPLTPPLTLSSTLTDKERRVLGTATGDKWIEIDLSDQTLTAHQGDSVFLTSLISSGLYDRTPPGEYRIWYKIVSTKMSGGIKGTSSYYYLPNVPYSMFFFGDYGIHGTYWHNNFGTPMSHGCINSPTPIAEKLFYWADPPLAEGKKSVRSTSGNPGTRVVIHK